MGKTVIVAPIDALSGSAPYELGVAGVRSRARPQPPSPKAAPGSLSQYLQCELSRSIAQGWAQTAPAQPTGNSARSIYAKRALGSSGTFSPQLQPSPYSVTGERLQSVAKAQGPLAAITTAFGQLQATGKLAALAAGLYLAMRVLK